MLTAEEFKEICQRLAISGNDHYIEALERHANATVDSAKLLAQLKLDDQAPNISHELKEEG